MILTNVFDQIYDVYEVTLAEPVSLLDLLVAGAAEKNRKGNWNGPWPTGRKQMRQLMHQGGLKFSGDLNELFVVKRGKRMDCLFFRAAAGQRLAIVDTLT